MTTKSKGVPVSRHSALHRVGSLWRGLHISARSPTRARGYFTCIRTVLSSA